MARLAVFFRRPISELRSQLPAWELVFWSRYLSKEPPPEDRLEILLANLSAMFANKGQRSARKKLQDFLFFKDAFQYVPNSGNPDVDSDIKQFMAAFGSRLVIQRRGE